MSGLDRSDVSTVLLIRGLAGGAGVALAGLLVDRNAWLTGLLAVALEAASLLIQYVGGSQPIVAVTAVAISAAALAAFAPAVGTLVLQVAPASTDLAAAGSTAFNVGITMGALLGSRLLTTGLRSIAIAGFAVATLALVAQLLEGRRGEGVLPVLVWADSGRATRAGATRPGDSVQGGAQLREPAGRS